jgi:hypothetical protein
MIQCGWDCVCLILDTAIGPKSRPLRGQQATLWPLVMSENWFTVIRNCAIGLMG